MAGASCRVVERSGFSVKGGISGVGIFKCALVGASALEIEEDSTHLPLFLFFCQAIRRPAVNELKEKVLGLAANVWLQLPQAGLVSKNREGSVQGNGEDVNTENRENTSFLITRRDDVRGFGSAVFGTKHCGGKERTLKPYTPTIPPYAVPRKPNPLKTKAPRGLIRGAHMLFSMEARGVEPLS